MAATTRPTGPEKVIALEGPKSLVPQPCQLVIFGGTGDLSWRKLLPAVYNLNVEGVLPSHFAVVAFGVPAEGATQADQDEFIRARARQGIERFSRRALDESHWADFARSLFFVQGSFTTTCGPTPSSRSSSTRWISSSASRAAECFTWRFRPRLCTCACSI